MSKVKWLNKGALYPLVLIVAMYAVYECRVREAKELGVSNIVEVTGTTMGVIPYQIRYTDTAGTDLSVGIDSVLTTFNQLMSTYIDDSEISAFGRVEATMVVSPYFQNIVKKAREVYQRTGGAFDPTVAPLVDFWGFGKDKTKRGGTQQEIDSLLSLVGYDKIILSHDTLIKRVPGVQLDFSAIAKGYACDLVSEYLSNRGFPNHSITIGGEVTTSGLRNETNKWNIAIAWPKESADLQEKALLPMSNQAMATSGNYMNFYKKDGKKYVHTINPVTGRPFQSDVLSASVIADDCMTADAFATAFMVMGAKKSIDFLKKSNDLAGYIIYEENGQMITFISEQIRAQIKEFEKE